MLIGASGHFEVRTARTGSCISGTLVSGISCSDLESSPGSPKLTILCVTRGRGAVGTVL